VHTNAVSKPNIYLVICGQSAVANFISNTFKRLHAPNKAKSMRWTLLWIFVQSFNAQFY